jgi:hypothetical protein
MKTSLLERLPWKFRKAMPEFEADERLLKVLHTHWMQFAPLLLVIFPLSLIIGLLVAGLTLPASSLLGTTSLLLSMVVSVLTLHWFFHLILSISLNDILITDRRILFLSSKLWLRDNMHEILNRRINAVEVSKKGVLQNMLDYGELWFDTGGSESQDRTQIVPYVPHPYHWEKQISDVIARIKRAE